MIVIATTVAAIKATFNCISFKFNSSNIKKCYICNRYKYNNYN